VTDGSLVSIFAECIGLEKIAGEYLCWMPEGFMMGVEGYEIPPVVVTRNFTFSDFPGKEDPEEGKRYHVLGKVDEDRMTIRAAKVWKDGEASPV